MENITNKMQLMFDAKSVNEAFARMTVMAFMADMNPTLDELEDVKTAVSEAVTNAIIHGYNDETKQVALSCLREGQRLTIVVEDKGVGIPNIEEARQPFYTTKPEEERSGMGFAFMEAFMDGIDIYSRPGEGTRITMTKYIARDRDR